ncbi:MULTISPECIES: NAD(P)H-dependent oxidoreductase [Chryseobacterium]|uniref:NADPH-quinone reductase n=1 Tax=Chryseobacterium camelliae TaxID=1265445 RepID=A0ABU0TE87_9FLAO|nr:MULTISPECIES: NAD(P)H-dependent oxidoreductase [Chryseobacterium]MDT3406936.1 putative NADPH-quinone reductase [Pseudacidovorax intermedius]MDQ1095271.1 putative NADPH-quinone reductase [Chryseobacterium camelliae]MDQ1099209.1 putative NADPH-quinone reductase [Chryseobacterium sp. SORGH_AS_1048]MDR6086559.1 putative NADPH-quinone reductase [Chryseobacterium sp. SORGH_AS_0909]MDR6130929.1 putative NADPH-quinone reductase [Chryseobacterium sp. SORGH_AS_1175]
MALLILGHPDIEKSLANRTIIEELKSSHPALEIRNLSMLYPDYNINAVAEQEALLRHDVVIFQYPLYWYSMPAILKHWFDVVFEYQFAYGSQGDKLKDKYFIPSFTVGAPEREYNAVGEHHFRVHEFCKNLEQTAYYTGMKYVDPIYFHGTSVNAGYTEESIKAKAKIHALALAEKLTEFQN